MRYFIWLIHGLESSVSKKWGVSVVNETDQNFILILIPYRGHHQYSSSALLLLLLYRQYFSTSIYPVFTSSLPAIMLNVLTCLFVIIFISLVLAETAQLSEKYLRDSNQNVRV